MTIKPMVLKKPKNKNRAANIRRRINEALDKNPSQTKADLARYCDVSPQAVNKWFKTGHIERDNIPHVAAFFGKDANWLLDDFVEVAGKIPEYQLRTSTREKNILDALHSMPEQTRIEIERFILNMAKTTSKTGGEK